MSESRLSYLFYRHVDGAITEAEKQELAGLAAQPVYRELLMQLMEESWETFSESKKVFSREESDQVLQTALTSGGKLRRISLFRRWGSAAAAILVILASAWLLYSKKPNREVDSGQIATNIAPGRDGAVLTLADGSKVVLDSLGNGIITNQHGTQVAIKNGQLTYNTTGNGPTTEEIYNTLVTSKGREFHVRLPDGTNVWLNAASSIRYPVVFKGKERKVNITGEAYFEVKENAAIPFRVAVANKTDIEVLGTHFNVNAYDNEANLSTTLLEGAVRVTASPALTHRNQESSMVLKPGQQARIAGAAVELVNNADLDKVMAWHNGLFNFQDASLQEVMNQLERWYAVDVVYEEGIPVKYFEGQMRRDMNLSEVLNALKETGLRYRIEEGRKLVIVKQ